MIKQRHCNPSLPPCKLIFVLLLGCPLILECHLSQFSAPLGTRDDLVTNFSKFLPSRRGMLAGKELLEPRTLVIVKFKWDIYIRSSLISILKYTIIAFIQESSLASSLRCWPRQTIKGIKWLTKYMSKFASLNFSWLHPDH